jgi:hypothetical protein
MKIVSIDAIDWRHDHPTGSLAFKYLLAGDDSAPDNFVLMLARQDKRFTTERHRHNFDQFRYPVHGDMNVGQGIKLRAGQLGYFTEGAPYGPQDDPMQDETMQGEASGDRLHLTLQFGGSTGYGYLSPDRLRACRDELRRDGEFVDIFYHRHDGKTLGGLDAVWQHAFGAKLEYPRPRYPGPIIMDPKSFHWTGNAGEPGVEHKYLGAFTERGTWAEIIRLQPGAQWNIHHSKARLLAVVLSGTGRCNDQALSRFSAVQVDPGERAEIIGTEPLELLIFGLPMITAAAATPAQRQQQHA